MSEICKGIQELEQLKVKEDRELLLAIMSAYKGGLKRDVLLQILKSHFSRINRAEGQA